jgi:hypothetical protein
LALAICMEIMVDTSTSVILIACYYSIHQHINNQVVMENLNFAVFFTAHGKLSFS